MSEDSILKCLIAFILGWLASRMMGNGFSVGGEVFNVCKTDNDCDTGECCAGDNCVPREICDRNDTTNW